MLVLHHLHAKLGVGRMHRNIYRLHTHFYYSVNVLLTHIRKSDVIAVNEGETRVVILKIKRLTKSLWVLVNKAKNTLVCARMLFIHERCFKIKAYVVVLALFDAYRIFLSITGKSDFNLTLGKIKTVVKHVVY